MANMMEMMKQVKQVKKMQKALAARTLEHESRDGLVRVVVSGDMCVKRVAIDPQALEENRRGTLEKTLASTVNGALDAMKKAAAEDMSKMTGGLGGLSGLLGG